MAQSVPLHAIVATKWWALPKGYVKRVRWVQLATGQGKKQNANVSYALRWLSVLLSWHDSSLLRGDSPWDFCNENLQKEEVRGRRWEERKGPHALFSPSPSKLPWPVAQEGICGSRGMVATLSLSAVRYLTCTSIWKFKTNVLLLFLRFLFLSSDQMPSSVTLSSQRPDRLPTWCNR